MTHILLVAAGGALGAVARYGVGTWLTPPPGPPALPWGTIAVNLVGCFLIGAVAGAADGRGGLGDGTRLFLVIGVLGGFTTFSAFGLETVSLVRAGAPGLALVNVAGQVAGGIAGVWAGWAAFR